METAFNDTNHFNPEEVNSRFQKGGALLSDMRVIVSVWEEGMEKKDPLSTIARALPKATLARVKDTYGYCFRQRFLNGSPNSSWKYARTLEELHPDLTVVQLFYYWLTARSEATLYGFVTEYVLPAHRAGNYEIRTEDAIRWLDDVNRRAERQWSRAVTVRTARGILAALRDFGILEGANRKTIAPISINCKTFCLIAFCLSELGFGGSALLDHYDWKLFLLGKTGVERLFLEAHQYGWLRFESAGSIVRVEFPSSSFMEYANVVLG